jgi:hypothetical protein
MQIGIIITGIIEDYYLDELIESYKGCEYYKIISTWNYIDNSIINKLKENNFIVVQSDFPTNIHKNSVNYQSYSTLVGIEKAKELNITHIIRVRGDMKCTNINKLLEIYQNIYENSKFISILFYKHGGGYLIDYGYFSDVNFCEKYNNSFQSNYDDRFSEKFRQEMCFGTDLNSIKDNIIYSGEILLRENIDFAYLKNGYRHYNRNIKDYITYQNTH